MPAVVQFHQPPRDAGGALECPEVYDLVMTDDPGGTPAYTAAQRAGAALGLAVLGLFTFILLDVLSGGKLTGRPCADCGDDVG